MIKCKSDCSACFTRVLGTAPSIYQNIKSLEIRGRLGTIQMSAILTHLQYDRKRFIVTEYPMKAANKKKK